MLPLLRTCNFALAVFVAVALFLVITATPLAQSIQLPSPTTHISDAANLIDPQTRSQLETLLANFKEKTKIELYVAMVDSTNGREIAEFSQRLAQAWNIGANNSRRKTLLLVVAASTKSSFTQFSRTVQPQLPDGVLGEMSYRMRAPLSEGRFTDAIADGVHVFVNAVAEKVGFNAAELDPSAAVAVANSATTATDSSKPISSGTREADKTRPRVVAEAAKVAEPQATPPAPEGPKADPTPTETPSPDASPAESPKPTPEAAPSESPKPTEAVPSESPKPESGSNVESAASESPKIDLLPESSKTQPAKPASRRTLNARGTTTLTKPAVKKTATQPVAAEDDEETVSLTLVLPVAERVAKLKEWLNTHPDSKERPRAIEYLVSAHATIGDQKLKNGDTAGGVEHLLLAIDEADPANTADKLFSGVIAQIPTNLYLRGEREAAFKAARNVETKFGSDAKRLAGLAGFYLGIERSDEAIRLGETAVKLAPDLAEAHRVLALGLHISLRLDEAAAEYKRALELDPTSKASRISLADLYRATGKAEHALALYNEQLLLDPKDRAARAGKVISLLELSRADEANTELEAALAAEPRNLPLLTGAAYWHVAHGNNDKALDLARKAVEVESRYTWAQIALAHAFLGAKRPLDAERAIRYARQYGKFPTLNYELANVLSAMGLYQEAADVLRESFEIKEGQIHTQLAGHLPASDASFLDLLAPERRAGIFQPTAADNAANANSLKALLALTTAIAPAEGEKINEAAAVAAAQDFAAGTDNMRAFRQVYAASRLLRNNTAIPTVLELTAAARKASDDALTVPVLTMAVQADEFRDLRLRAISAGSIPDVADAPQSVLSNILKGRIEDLEGWAMFHQEKYPAAIEHLKQAEQVLPVNTPLWRSALWHLGVVLEQTGQKEQALDYYLKSYKGGEPDSVRRPAIEQLYKKIYGSMDGFEDRLNGTTTEPAKTAEAPKTEPAAEAPKPEPVATPTPEQPKSPEPISDESLRAAASRVHTTIRITGRVLDANKTGLANVTVVLISPSGSVLASTTDNEGNYSFTVAPSQKTYRIIPSKDGYSFAPVDRTFAALIDDQKDVDFTAKP